MKVLRHECMLPKQPRCMDLPPTANFLEKIVCYVRQLMFPCEWHHGTIFYIRSRKKLALETERQLSSACAIVWHPYSAIKFYWDSIGFIVTGIILLYLPFQVFLNCPNPYDPLILFSDIFAALDICTKFITGYNDEDKKTVVLNLRQIAKHYVRGTFILDLVGALPLQMYAPYSNCKYPSHTIMYIFKLPRLITLKEKWQNAYRQLELSYVKTTAVGVILQVMLFFHWMTYIHYQVPVLLTHSMSHSDWTRRSRNYKSTNETALQKYTSNLYRVVGLCIGAGYYMPVDEFAISDLLLTSAISVVGLIFIIISFATVFRLFMYHNYDRYSYNGKMRDLKDYMTLKKLPDFLQKKILLFVNYKFNGTYFNEEYILDTINEQIKQDINMYKCKDLVLRIPLFQNLPVASVNAIIFNLVEVLFMPGEVIVSLDEPTDCLYIISSGSVTVMDANGKEVTHLRDGEYFGEDALREPTKARKTTIIALEITEAYKLSAAAGGGGRPRPDTHVP